MPLSSPEAKLETCLLRDRKRLRRRLKALAGPAVDDGGHPDVLAEIERSAAMARLREENLPEPAFPAELPISGRVDEIEALLRAHQVIVLCGETGSGKSTQLPKLCLRLRRGIYGRIGHTQPRRIAARSLAARIASELGEEVGNSVGYKVRFRDHVADQTHIKLLTDGMLLAEVRSDPELLEYDTLIIDEAHERSLNIDFLLGYLHKLLRR
ncbi:MAG: AAA family ATPase, partial [Gammaproteobacteria bacterium]|nr:AAA family ATPase [Gammaproteobacteria bacterium]